MFSGKNRLNQETFSDREDFPLRHQQVFGATNLSSDSLTWQMLRNLILMGTEITCLLKRALNKWCCGDLRPHLSSALAGPRPFTEPDRSGRPREMDVLCDESWIKWYTVSDKAALTTCRPRHAAWHLRTPPGACWTDVEVDPNCAAQEGKLTMVKPEMEAEPAMTKSRNDENGRRIWMVCEFGVTLGCKGCHEIGQPHTVERGSSPRWNKILRTRSGSKKPRPRDWRHDVLPSEAATNVPKRVDLRTPHPALRGDATDQQWQATAGTRRRWRLGDWKCATSSMGTTHTSTMATEIHRRKWQERQSCETTWPKHEKRRKNCWSVGECQGGVPICAACFLHAEGWSARNEELMKAVFRRVAKTRCRWIIACDASMDRCSSNLEAGTTKPQRRLRCLPVELWRTSAQGAGDKEIGKVLDFFMVSESMASSIDRAEVVHCGQVEEGAEDAE